MDFSPNHTAMDPSRPTKDSNHKAMDPTDRAMAPSNTTRAPSNLTRTPSNTTVDPSNPFVHKLHFSFLQKVKLAVLGILLLPLRIIVILVSLSLASGLACLGLRGLTEEQVNARPFTGWRLYTRYAICAILRVMFALLGFWWVEVIGEQASPEDAPILAVAPHSTYFDALAVAVMGAPSVVAKYETSSLPFWGSLIKYTQPLLVRRTDPDSRKTTVRTMKERSEKGKGWQQVLIFPEGTCTNRSCLITFRLGAFTPGVPVQPVIIRYNNMLDTVTWTWEGISALRVALYTMSQFAVHLSLEFLPPYSPSKEEIENPQLYANNVRKVMAERMGVSTTDCSYYDYLRINKAAETVKALRGLQRKLMSPLLEVTSDLSEENQSDAGFLGLGEELEDFPVVSEICGKGEMTDMRYLWIAALMATEADPYETFISESFQIFDRDLGVEKLTDATLQRIVETFLYLPPKEVTELLTVTSQDGEVSQDKLREFIPDKRPNYIKVISKWEGGLTKVSSTDLLAMSTSLTAAAEKATEKATQLMAAGKEVFSDASATMAASRDKVSDVFSSAVTSLHKRTGSRSETDKKDD